MKVYINVLGIHPEDHGIKKMQTNWQRFRRDQLKWWKERRLKQLGRECFTKQSASWKKAGSRTSMNIFKLWQREDIITLAFWLVWENALCIDTKKKKHLYLVPILRASVYFALTCSWFQLVEILFFFFHVGWLLDWAVVLGLLGPRIFLGCQTVSGKIHTVQGKPTEFHRSWLHCLSHGMGGS